MPRRLFESVVAFFFLRQKLESDPYYALFILRGGTYVRVFARKEHHLSLLPQIQLKTAKAQTVSPGSLRDSFHGWLDSVAPTSTSTVTLVPRLTAFDVMRVNHATIREGESHRIWPPSIFEKFWSSKVITDKKVQHYELKDVNLRRIF